MKSSKPTGTRAILTRSSTQIQRLWPLALEAYRRWDRLSDNEKQRYRDQASGILGSARDTLARRRSRR